MQKSIAIHTLPWEVKCWLDSEQTTCDINFTFSSTVLLGKSKWEKLNGKHYKVENMNYGINVNGMEFGIPLEFIDIPLFT